VTSTQAEAALSSLLDETPITNGVLSYRVSRAEKQVYVDYQYNQRGLFYLLPHVYKTGQVGATVVPSASLVGIKGTYLLASGQNVYVRKKDWVWFG
jgi:hypothetical protein